MKEIELTSINFETLKKFEDIETQESVVYHDDKKVYKLIGMLIIKNITTLR